MTNDYSSELTGTLTDIIYYNEENGYAVLEISSPDEEGCVTATGVIPFCTVGEKLTLFGSWVNHQVYGRQFSFGLTQRVMPQTSSEIYTFLASGVVKGIRSATASKIVSKFGKQSLEIIENDPDRLTEIAGITGKKALKISSEFKKQMALRRLIEFLAANDVEQGYAMRIYSAYAEKSLEALKSNPYIVCMPHIGAPFMTADKLATALGFSSESSERVSAAVSYTLRDAADSGHTYLPKAELCRKASRLLGSGVGSPEAFIEELSLRGELHREEKSGEIRVYLRSLYNDELFASEKLREFSLRPAPKVQNISAIISEIEERLDMSYAPMQRKALMLAAENMLLCLTGGPGTGKTTVVRALIELFRRMGLKISIAAPTGRAAKRMEELTDFEASTVHRLLEATYSEDGSSLLFKRNETNRLSCDVLILDESSMLDISLMKSVLAALPSKCRLILVGDADQLPSVGPGTVFRDLIECGLCPTVRLKEIFRQAEGSRIITNAHKINEGEHPDILLNKGDFYFMRRNDPEEITRLISDLCSRRLPDNMGISPDEIQVLTPQRKGPNGVYALNKALQEVLNPHSRKKNEKHFGDYVFREGDRVMQIRNNYDLLWETADGRYSGSGIYNGDIGYIIEINKSEETLVIDYDGRRAEYLFDQLSEIEHAWAMTVHKSQGSEYRACILCITNGAPALMHRGVLYTGVTRARELLIIVGNEQAVHSMIDKKNGGVRYSGLKERLAVSC